MSWLFSRVLVEEYLGGNFSDGEQCAPLNGNPTPQLYCAPDRMTAFSRLSRFGMTCAPLTADRGAAVLTSYLAAFPARTSAPPEKAPASTAGAAASGAKWPESSVKYCRASSSWKTHRSLWDEALPWSSVTLPRWGMTLDGVVLQHPTSERPIGATASGLLETYPTPNCYDAIPDYGNRKDNNLESGGRHGVSLRHLVKTWPTPTKSDYKGSGPAMLRSDGKMRGDRLDYALERNQDGTSTGGQLNPTWVEWLMGWPLGWTDLKPLAMDKFREWLRQHGGF